MGNPLALGIVQKLYMQACIGYIVDPLNNNDFRKVAFPQPDQ